MHTHASLPTIQASCPGAMLIASPGPYSASLPSSMTTFIRPATTYPKCAVWQLCVFAIGFTHSDQRHPGSNVARPMTPFSSFTISSLPLSNVRVSSGTFRLFFSIVFAIARLLVVDQSVDRVACEATNHGATTYKSPIGRALTDRHSYGGR